MGGGFPFDALEKTLATHNVSLKFRDDDLDGLLDGEYGKRNTFSVLAAAYPALNTQFKFHLDHIFPKSGFDRRKLKRAGYSDDDIESYSEAFNLLPNLQLLEGVTNQSKLDTPFEDWIKPLQADPAAWAVFKNQHMIPEMTGYPMPAFLTFFAARRALLLAKLKNELPCA